MKQEEKPLGLVLGSGLDPLVERVEVRQVVSFAEAGLPGSSVPGHRGEFVHGSLGGAPVWAMRGRVHLYEGHSAAAVTAGIRWMHERGIGGLIVTNAAGSLDPGLAPGTWMAIEDQLNLTGESPLTGGPAFVDLSEAYQAAWRDAFVAHAAERGLRLGCGVYAGLRGPQYETPAEVRMLRGLGADAVGMSTVLETIQARALGLPVLGLSCLTNWAAGLPGASLDHGEVVATGREAAAAMGEAIESWLAKAGSPG